MSQPSRRQLIVSSMIAMLVNSTASFAAIIRGALPFASRAYPPEPVTPGPWRYFTSDEGATVEALVDRLIPPDPQTPGGKDAGCAVFIDGQLAGPYGSNGGLFTSGPFHQGTPQQGPQSQITPAEQYRKALASLDDYCRKSYANKTFVQLTDADKDSVIGGLENGKVALEGTDAKTFFNQLLTDTQQGFLSDPIYGGNKDMVAWRMIGFPGTRYDYRDWVDKHNQPYPNPPVSIADHHGWSP